ncbi:MAG: SGNH/GDSL hydrolase family protein [Pyrinomonadaceae bacterium]
MKKLVFIAFILFGSYVCLAQEKVELTWYNAVDLGIDGRGWEDPKAPFDRLPDKAKGKVSKDVWSRALNSAGLNVSFATDSEMIVVRWKLRHPSIYGATLSPLSVGGLDLYLRENNKWYWAAAKSPKPPSVQPESIETFLRGLPKELLEFRMYLPSYNGLEKLEIGVIKDSKFGKAVENTTEKPLVFYGGSLIQGSASSRPGMTLVSQLNRRLNRETINLGFSGTCKMESEFGDLLAELDPAMYVIDCLPSMTAAEIKERTEKFVKKIRKANPETPIVFLGTPNYSQSLWNPSVQKSIASKNRIIAAQFAQLQKDGYKRIYYLKGENLFPSDGESTVDGVLPTDYGFKVFADALEPLLRRILQESENK